MDDRDAGLVRFLMRERHGTPFEHNFFRFHIKAPLFVTREWQRHRIGSFNERSGRYSELPDEFYVPAASDVRTQVGKPGAYTFEPLPDDAAEEVRSGIESSYAESYGRYQRAARRRRRQGGRAQRPAGRPLHGVLLVGQRALADELPLAAQRARLPSTRSASTRRPPSSTSRAHARHARLVRGSGTDGSLSTRPRRELEVRELGDGVHRVTQPLPWALDHVHCYAVDDAEGWTLIDCGLGTPGTGRRWQEALALLGHPHVRRIVITHYHPDHIGASTRLAELTGAEEIVQGSARPRADRAHLARSRLRRALRALPRWLTACRARTPSARPTRRTSCRSRPSSRRTSWTRATRSTSPASPSRCSCCRATPTATSRCSAGTAGGCSAATSCSTRSRRTSGAGRTTSPIRWAATSRRSRASRSWRRPWSTPAIAA